MHTCCLSVKLWPGIFHFESTWSFMYAPCPSVGAVLEFYFYFTCPACVLLGQAGPEKRSGWPTLLACSALALCSSGSTESLCFRGCAFLPPPIHPLNPPLGLLALVPQMLAPCQLSSGCHLVPPLGCITHCFQVSSGVGCCGWLHEIVIQAHIGPLGPCRALCAIAQFHCNQEHI